VQLAGALSAHARHPLSFSTEMSRNSSRLVSQQISICQGTQQNGCSLCFMAGASSAHHDQIVTLASNHDLFTLFTNFLLRKKAHF
jgi:hypothetical protein